MTDAEFLDVEQLAERWHLTARAVRDEIGRKRLRATKIGGQWLVRPVDVETFERSRMNVVPAAKRTRAPRKRVA
ncbi:helix-turn-helix domain-containing protein [Jatrophihabitans sp.]|uniref:helix-turn-helix domain-containing protein n=1 Tax=Jatrophihabitans sp. TaxID=1932789 RepID=UPI0030C721BB|nr:Helix-turn-helix domain [Jatrophihabitans sp.]